MRYEAFNVGKASAYVRGYIHEDLTPFCDSYKKRPSIIICPGGGYQYLSPREADPVAIPLFSAGFQVFILYYSTDDDIASSWPEAELAETVAHIKEHSEQFDADPDKIAVMGFSAGAHVAGSLLCHHERYGESARPSLGILANPVITTGEFCHKGSASRITLGGREDLMKYYSLETQVSDNTPPCFIWHTEEDNAVPIQNSLMFLSSLIRHGVSTEFHMYPRGRHGLSTARREVGTEKKEVQSWLNLLISWLNLMWDFEL